MKTLQVDRNFFGRGRGSAGDDEYRRPETEAREVRSRHVEGAAISVVKGDDDWSRGESTTTSPILEVFGNGDGLEAGASQEPELRLELARGHVVARKGCGRRCVANHVVDEYRQRRHSD